MTDIENLVENLKHLLPAPTHEIRHALCPKGVLRAGISLSNFLLVTGKSSSGAPEGVSPDMAKTLANLLQCDIDYCTFDSPGAVADAAQEDVWDIGNIGADPARSDFINFTSPYCEIESTCLVRKDSPMKSCHDIDKPDVTISTKKRAAYTLWLERNIKHAQLIQFDTMDDCVEGFLEQNIAILAGLRPRLMEDVARLNSMRLLPDKFAAVQQAIGTPKTRSSEGISFLEKFIMAAKETGLVKAFIEKHGVSGKLSVASI